MSDDVLSLFPHVIVNDSYLLQGGSETGTILGSTPSLKLKKVKEVVMRVEGNCCWTVHARKKFKVRTL